MIYGVLSNSLGLISDSVHMFFDCSALVLTLIATYFASLPPNNKFQYGYGRIEVISGFTNCIFLVFVASSIILESLERLIRPQQIIADQLLNVAILGLIVNIAGIFLLINPEEEDDQPTQNINSNDPVKYQALPTKSEELHEIAVVSTSNNQTDTSSSEQPESSKEPEQVKKHKRAKNENLAGLFLHITSDALGSVGVIISAACIKYYNMIFADPVCSLMISGLIIASIISLLKSTVATLTMKLSQKAEKRFGKIGLEILGTSGISDCDELKIWVLRRNEMILTSKLQIENNADKEKMLAQIRGIIEGHSIKNSIVEIIESNKPHK